MTDALHDGDSVDRMLFESAGDAINDAIFLLSPEYRILRCNKASYRIFDKVKLGEILGKFCWEVVHGTAEQQPECPIVVMEKTKKRETAVIKSGGRWLEITVDPVLDENNNISGTVHVVSDITRRKQAQDDLQKAHDTLEQRVRERTSELETANRDLQLEITQRQKAEASLRGSEERYRRITEGLTDYLYTVHIKDDAAVKTIHNQACEMVTGYTVEEFNRNSYLWLNMLPLEDREPVVGHVQKVLGSRIIQTFRHRLVRKDGVIRWVSTTLIPHVDEFGKLISYDGVIKDITELKEAELELKRSRDALIEHNRILVSWTSPEVLHNPDFGGIVTRITETVAAVVKVERVSIWLFNSDFSILHCMDLFEMDTGKHSNDTELDVMHYPSYFNALRKEQVIVSNNPLGDPIYAELADVYFKPNGITSILDVPVFVAGEIFGVICIEHQGERREWTVEEQNFAISVGNIFSLALGISRDKKLEKSIQTAKDNFVNIVEKLPCPLLIVNMKGTVKYVNAACESFFGPQVRDMLGAQFPCPVSNGKGGEIDFIRPGGSGEKVKLSVVQTRWDSEPAHLIFFQELSPKPY